jgi:vitamin B12 transporter
VDGTRGLGRGTELRLGAEAERVEASFRGTVPAVADVFDPSAEVVAIDDRLAGWRTGGYAELEARLAPGVAARAGARVDRADRTGETVLDPRVSLVYAWAPGTHARLAWGIYHQFPAMADLGADEGNPELRAMRAEHLVAGVERRDERLTVRLEGYRKRYRGLVVSDPERNRENAGRGWAHGVDVFAKYGESLQTPLSGWVSYSWMRSERTQARRLGAGETLESGPSPFGATHNLTLVGHGILHGRFGAGFTLRYAAGRPHTPVVGAEPGPGGAYFLPVEGPVGSERLPAYARLDVQLTRTLPLGSAGSGVVYVAASNLLDRANVVGYEYSPDYSRRVPQESPFHRSVYFGVTATLRLP